MKIIIASKNNEKTFENCSVINIGTTQNCNYIIDTKEAVLISLQQREDGKWQIVNNIKNNVVLFRGQPLNATITINTVCKLMLANSDEFIGIKIINDTQAQAPTPNQAPKSKLQKTVAMIQSEDLTQQDIKALYGNGDGVQAKLKIDKMKIDIDKKRASIIKEISYKTDYLRQKIAQNEMLLGFLNAFIFIVPFTMAYVLKDLIIFQNGKGLQAKVIFLFAVSFVILTFLLKQGQFLFSQNRQKNITKGNSKLIEKISLFCSYSTFTLIALAGVHELWFHKYNIPALICNMVILSVFLCVVLGVFAGFTKNTISESAEELDGHEGREDLQEVMKKYQQWIHLFINNFSRKKIKTISEKIFNLNTKAILEYVAGVVTAPFLAYGVSQTLAECFPEAAGWIRLSDGFKFSPVFWTLSTIMICFAFHCFAVSFATTKRIAASNVIKQDGYNDYNVHGILIHGVESCKALKKESKKFFLIAMAIIFIEITMNSTYFIGVMGDDIQGMLLSFIAALVPTAILIAETTMLGNTKFDIIVKEELLEAIDKEY